MISFDFFRKKKTIAETHHAKWWAFNLEETFDRLSSSEKGLLDPLVRKKQEKFGFNVLPRKESRGPKEIFLDQCRSVLVLTLFGAAIISFIFGDTIDALIIFLALVINVIFSFWQEYKGSRALANLRALVLNNSRVIRGGQELVVDSRELVPGDVVILATGDRAAADLRLIKTNNLSVVEAALTGEPQPRGKHTGTLKENTILAERENMVFMGTLVVEGSGVGVVVETGLNTEVGQIAELVLNVKEEKTPLQQRLNRLAFFLTKSVLALCLIIFFLGIFTGHKFIEMFTMAVAITVAAIPEGLVLTVTMMLALSMRRILRSQALVKNLLAAEVLGSTEVVCVDKTGTITEGNMEVARLVTLDSNINVKTGSEALEESAAAEQLLMLRMGVLCNNAYISQKADILKISHLAGNLTERALLLAGHQLGLDQKVLNKQFPRLDEIPFDSEKKFMATLHAFDEKNNIIYLKGAPEKILLFCNYVFSNRLKIHLELNAEKRESFVGAYEKMSKEGLRVLAFAYKLVPVSVTAISDQKLNDLLKQEMERQNPHELYAVKQEVKDFYTNFTFVGLAGLEDPLRADVKEVFQATKSAGLNTVIITGDNKFTAQKIGHDLGLEVGDGHLMDGVELEKISETDLKERVREVNIYARTTPEQKLKIVKAWQDIGAVVAMTGDGINDTPALKQADIGLALGTGSDVAREVADVVLLDNNFKTILAAVREGRNIFENIKKTVLYFLSDSLIEVFIISFSLLAGLPLPLLASQIIWVNLIDDTFPALALTQDPVTKDVLKEKPVKKSTDIINFEMKSLILIISLVTSVLLVGIFYLLWNNNPERLDLARTIIFTIHALDTLVYCFCLRDLSRPVWRTNLFNNKMLLWAIAAGFALQLAVIYNSVLRNIFHTVALDFSHWLIVVGCVIILVLVIELVKWIFVRKERK